MLLNCHTYYSFGYGTYSPEELMDAVLAHGYPSFALTDINNTSACLDTIRLCRDKGLKVVVGIDYRNEVQQQYIGLAINNQGFYELNKHLSEYLHAGRKFEPIAPSFSNVYIIYPFSVYTGWPLREYEFVGIPPDEIPRMAFWPVHIPSSKRVALHTVTFASKLQFNAHRLLRAIDTNCLLSKLPLHQQSELRHSMISHDQLASHYRSDPDMIARAHAILSECRVDFEYGKLANKNLSHYTDSIQGDIDLLRSECMRGLHYRYPNPSEEVMQRIEKELDVIAQLKFASYFLINWDIITYARHKNYFYVGRGSGANSILAYILRITDVDPIELDLYFERFINLYRNNAPDFDMDFSWTDRDDITRYIFTRFGYKRTALLGAYSTFQHDAVIRELGKVFGLPSGEIDALQRVVNPHDADEMGRLVLRYSELIKGFPSHLSIHSSGILISEAPIYNYTATIMPPKGYPTTQFSMLEAEDIGLYKFDILSQRGLGKIKDTVDLVKQNQGVDIDVHDVPRFKRDERVKKMLRTADTIGCFYIESPAMRMLLTKLEAEDYLRLVAASSIIRPGVARSGMMNEYIVRYRHQHLRDKARNELPELYDILHETYGVMVYQEDVIKVAHLFAGLSLAEADYLRRGMSWKFKQRNEFARVKENFFVNCRKKGYAEKKIGEIWHQIESFGNFAFSKGHSASYAVESYQALYLKAYFPLEYMVATINNGGGFYRRELYLHEARMCGAEVRPPCVNKSGADAVIYGNVIYLGLSMMRDIEHHTVEAILRSRAMDGEYKDMYDFIHRIPLSLEQMRILIRAGAFDFTGRNKKELLWEIHAVLQPISKPIHHIELFEVDVPEWQLAELVTNEVDEAYEQIDLFGFTLGSPFRLLRDALPSPLKASQLRTHIHQQVCIVGYLITVKYARTIKGERMYFGTFIDTEGKWIDTVHFPNSARQYPFRGTGCYAIKGKVIEEFDFISIDVSEMQRLHNVNLD